MIQLSPVVQTLLAYPSAEIIYLVRVGKYDDPEKILTTSFYTDFELDYGGGTVDTFLSDGRLARIDGFDTSEVVDSANYSIYFADPLFLDVSTVNENAKGFISKKVEVRAAFLNVTDSPIVDSEGNTVQPDQPFTSMIDTIVVYAGRVNEISLVTNTEVAGDVMLKLTCSSPMANLDFVRSFRLNKDQVRERLYTDSACDFVKEDGTGINLLWGKQ